MLDAIMEYISTGTLPHVFHEDNVKISNSSNNYLTKRLENNELHKFDYTIICILINIYNNIFLQILGTPKLLIKVILMLFNYPFLHVMCSI